MTHDLVNKLLYVQLKYRTNNILLYNLWKCVRFKEIQVIKNFCCTFKVLARISCLQIFY